MVVRGWSIAISQFEDVVEQAVTRFDSLNIAEMARPVVLCAEINIRDIIVLSAEPPRLKR